MENQIKIYKKQNVIGVDGKSTEILVHVESTNMERLILELEMFNRQKDEIENTINQNLLKQDLIKNIGDLDYIVLP